MHDSLYSAVSKLTELLETQYQVNDRIWPLIEFETISYSRWAIYEIQSRLMRASDCLPESISGRAMMSPKEVISWFIEDMEYCLDMTTSEKAKILFTTSINVSNNVLHILQL